MIPPTSIRGFPLQATNLPQDGHPARWPGRLSLRALGLVARVHPDERRDVAGAFLTLFGFMTGHALLETARDALFLARLPARQLPWVYLAIAVLALVIGQREPRVVRRVSARSELGRWLVFAGGVTLAFWTVAGQPWSWVFHALYVWSGVLASLVVVRFWTVLGSRFTLTQAKRIFAVVASGSVAGAIVGSGAARLLTAVVTERHLVLAAGLVFLVAARAPAWMGEEPAARRPRSSPVDDLARVARTIWGGPYLRRVAAMVLLATVTFTLVDFVFKSTADRLVAPERLGEFFSSVYLVLNLLSLLVQVVGVAWLLRYIGVTTAVAVVPAILVVSTVGFAVGGGLALALLLKGADGTLRHSLYRTGTELLFLPLSERLRTDVKGVIDVLGQRGGQALASILILMVLSTTASESVFAAIACLTAAAWLALATGLREHYLNMFRETLDQDGLDLGPPSPFPALDVASLEALLATLNSPDERRVVTALGLLQEQGKTGVIPALLLYHPSPAVVVRTLEVLSVGRRDDVISLARGLLAHADRGVRVAALRLLSSLQPERPLLESSAESDDPLVSTTALVALMGCDWLDAARGAPRLLELVGSGDAEVQIAVARAIQTHPAAAAETVLKHLLELEDVTVLRESVQAARLMRSPILLDPLLALLGRRSVRDEARRALATFGPVGLARMVEALEDPSVPHVIRRHLPGAMAMVGSVQVPEALLRHLAREPDGMIRFKILRALGRWRKEQPHLPLDTGLLGEALQQALKTGYQLMDWRHALAQAAAARPEWATEIHEVLVALLRDKEDHALERIFRLLNLQTGSEEFPRLYRGLHSPRSASRAGSRELLQHLVLPPVRRHLLVLVDDLRGEGDPSVVRPAISDHGAYARLLSEIIGCGMESASSLAAAHAVELGIGELSGVLAAAQPLSEEHGRTLFAAADALGASA